MKGTEKHLPFALRQLDEGRVGIVGEKVLVLDAIARAKLRHEGKRKFKEMPPHLHDSSPLTGNGLQILSRCPPLFVHEEQGNKSPDT